MTTPDLAAIEARANAATPGPWDRPLNTRYRASVTADMPKGDPSSRWRDQVDKEGNPERVSIVNCPIWSDGKFFRKQSGRDLEFIAHARTDVPALLALVREQRAVIERVKALVDNTFARADKRNYDDDFNRGHVTGYNAAAHLLRAAITEERGAAK
jgi:hypothetical protein